MFDCADVSTDPSGLLDDPRIDSRFLRCVPGADGSGSVLLVGVVHDHPASVYRAARLTDVLNPAVLAVELPPLAVSLFGLYADDRYVPPRLGGEMSAGIQAAGNARVVGIDAPNGPYFGELARILWADWPGVDVVRTLLRDVFSGGAQAVACRLGALLGSVTPLRPRVYTHIEYDSSMLDEPTEQAAHESSHVTRRQSFLRAVEIPPAIRIVDTARERSMIARLSELRTTGDVVAIVGIEHLEGVHSGLNEEPQ